MKFFKDILIIKIAPEDNQSVNNFFESRGYGPVFYIQVPTFSDETHEQAAIRNYNAILNQAENIGCVAIAEHFATLDFYSKLIDEFVKRSISVYVIGKDFSNQRPGLWLNDKVPTIK